MLRPCFVIRFLMSFKFCKHIAEENGTGCFILIIFLLSCYRLCSVSFLHVSMVGSWSVIVAFPGHTFLFIF